MKKYPKIVQMDARGQIVIPKDIRIELGLEEGAGFYMYSVTNEGILLKKLEPKELAEHREILDEVIANSAKIKVDKANVERSVKKYKKTKEGGLEII